VGDNGTPKRRRTGRNDSDAGSQSAPPKITNNSDRNIGSTRQTAAAIYVTSGRDNGKRKLFELESLSCTEKVVEAGTSSSLPSSNRKDTPETLSDVHKSVVDAFAPSALSPGQASSSASASPSYAKFLHTLTKSGSDKTFMFQKKYKEELGPILETVNEEDPSEEQVDYDTTDSESAATSERYIIPGTGVMALAAPSRQ
jgi:hypothetical protein